LLRSRLLLRLSLLLFAIMVPPVKSIPTVISIAMVITVASVIAITMVITIPSVIAIPAVITITTIISIPLVVPVTPVVPVDGTVIHRVVIPVGESRGSGAPAAIDSRILRPGIIQIAHPVGSHSGKTHIAVVVPGRIVYPGTVNVQSAVVYLPAGHGPVGIAHRHGP
jgi:hypothetical protein